MKRIGIDIGGTKVNIGLVENGQVLAQKIFFCAELESFSAAKLIEKIKQQVDILLQDNQLTMDEIIFLGVGIPGSVDKKGENILYSPNLFGENIPFGQMLTQTFRRTVMVCQDSSAAALAEHLYGAGTQWESFLCVTLGTGIGCGIISDGHVYKGATNTAGEVGHISIDRHGVLCNCGMHGCLERYSSGTGIALQAADFFAKQTPPCPPASETLFELAYAGNKEALQLISDAVQRLGFGLAMAIDLLGIDKILVSGGLCNHQTLIIDPLEEYIYSYGYPAWVNQRSLSIQKALLGSNAPVIGAAYYDLAYKEDV